MSAGDQRLYNVNRDVAHNFDAIIKAVATALEEARWDTLTGYAREKGVTDDDLGQGCACLINFVLGQLDKKESMACALSRSGWLDLKPEVRVIIMAYMGKVVLGMNWAGVHETTLGGDGPLLGYRRLRWYGQRCIKLMKLPWWRRKLYRLGYRLRQAWRAFRGFHVYED
jgi:hypothetical protein